MSVISKSLESKMLRIQREHEKKVRVKVTQWLDYSRRTIIKGINKTMIRKDQADNIVMELAEWTEIETEGVIMIKPAMLSAIAAAGQETYKIVGIKLSFDMLNPAAVELAQTITADMVREVTEETKEALRWAIRDGVNQGKSMRQVGKSIRPKVGLTLKQVQAVANYEEKLLVDKPHWKREQIDRNVARYENRLHRKRAEMIARTETSRAVSEGTLMAYEEAGVDAQWYTRGDAACEICAANDGGIYTVAEARGLIPAHPNCICGWRPAVAL